MKILFLSSFHLFPSTHFGGAKRLYYLARELEKKCTFLSLVALDGCCEKHEVAKDDGFSSTFDVRFKDASRFSLNHIFRLSKINVSSEDIKTVRDHVRKNVFNFTIVAFPLALNILENLPRKNLGNIVYLEDDLYIEKLKNDVEKAKRSKKLWKWIRWKQELHFMQKAMKKVALCFAISKQEQLILKQYFPHLQSEILKYAINIKEFSLLPKREDASQILGFVGNYSHMPNKEAIEYFLRSVFPEIKSRFPSIILYIGGRNIPDSIRLFADERTIRVVDPIEDLSEFYRNISIFVNPIISGRGLRTKLVEAAAFGRPIISTPLGAEGLEDLNVYIATTPEDFSRGITLYSTDRTTLHKTIDYNRKLIETNYSIDSVIDFFLRSLSYKNEINV